MFSLTFEELNISALSEDVRLVIHSYSEGIHLCAVHAINVPHEEGIKIFLVYSPFIHAKQSPAEGDHVILTAMWSLMSPDNFLPEGTFKISANFQ